MEKVQIPLDVPYESRRAATWAGARWDRRRRLWVAEVDGGAVDPKLGPFIPAPYSIQRLAYPQLNGGPTLGRFAAGTLPTFLSPHPERAGGDDGAPLIELRPHQTEASDAIVEARRAGLPGFLLADEVGLGKTFAVVDAVWRLGAERRSGLKILVLAPLSVVPAWRRSLALYGDGGHLWCVTNYEKARQLLSEPTSAKQAKRTRTKNRRHAAEGRSKIAWDIVICDESHRLKNPTSQRSAAVRQLINTGPAGTRTDPAFVIWMSATAGQDPLELAYLAPLLAARTGQAARSLSDFEAWCQSLGFGVRRGKFGAWEWDGHHVDPRDTQAMARREADLERMRRLLFEAFDPKIVSGSESVRRRAGAKFRSELADGKGSPAAGGVVAGLRRRPTDIAGWPELNRALAPQELNASERELYQQAWEEFCAAMSADGAVRNKKGKKAVSSNGLVAALRFRQKASLLRAPHTAQMIKDLLGDGYQVAVSVQFLDTAERISEHLGSVRHVVLSGEVGQAVREERRLAFQRGEAPVVIFTPTEGFSLHASELLSGGTEAEAATATPRVLLIHDLRWSALELAQIEGRTHRDGQAAVAHYLYAEATVEERVVSRVLQRMGDMSRMLGDDTVVLDALLAEV